MRRLLVLMAMLFAWPLIGAEPIGYQIMIKVPTAAAPDSEVQQRGLGDLLSRLDDLVERFEKVVDKLELTLYVEGGDEE